MASGLLPLVRLAKTEIVTSRLGFGTARLHYLAPRERQALLAAAAELGVVHFDSAPAYGDGIAETELGRFAASERDRFVIATKYGIPADPLVEAMPMLAFPVHAVRAMARRAGRWSPQLLPITAAGLRKSAERSLRRMRTDRIDILFLHEPNPQRLLHVEEILEELCRLQRTGLIRAFGLAGGWSGVDALRTAAPALAQIMQTAEGEWPPEFPPEISYGAISPGAQNYFAARIDPVTATERLRSALERRPRGVVLISTTKRDHLRCLAEQAR